jgi:peroxiredoxin
LQAYQKYLPEMRALGASLVAVSPQTPDNSLTTVEKDKLEFPVLSDVGNAVARRYGLVFTLTESLQQSYRRFLPTYNGDESFELPVPATYVIDQKSKVRLAYLDTDYRRRLDPVDILECLRGLGR